MVNIFLFWEGQSYSLLNILRELIIDHSKKYNYNLILLNNSNINDYIKEFPKNYDKLSIQHKSDYIRIKLLYEYGGVWLDSDTLLIENMDSIINLINIHDGFFIRENNCYICNGVIGSRTKTELFENILKLMIYRIELGTPLQWTEIGSSILEYLYNNTNLFNNYAIFDGLDNVYPINWDRCIDEFIDKPYDNYRNIERSYQPFIILVNSVYKHLEKYTEEQIWNMDIPLVYFLKKSKNI
jgi:hypothetical protein